MKFKNLMSLLLALALFLEMSIAHTKGFTELAFNTLNGAYYGDDVYMKTNYSFDAYTLFSGKT